MTLIRDDYKEDDAHMLLGNKFSPPATKHNNISRDTFQSNNNSLPSGKFLTKLKHHINHNLSDVPNFSGVSLLAVNQ